MLEQSSHRSRSRFRTIRGSIWVAFITLFICWLGTTTLTTLLNDSHNFRVSPTSNAAPHLVISPVSESEHLIPESFAYALADGSLWIMKDPYARPEQILPASDKPPSYTKITWAPNRNKLLYELGFGKYEVGSFNLISSQAYLFDISSRQIVRQFNTQEGVGSWSPDSKYFTYFKYSDSSQKYCSQSNLIDSTTGNPYLPLHIDTSFPNICWEYFNWSYDSNNVLATHIIINNSDSHPSNILFRVSDLSSLALPDECINAWCKILENPADKDQLILFGDKAIFSKSLTDGNVDWKTLFSGDNLFTHPPIALPTGEILAISDQIVKIKPNGSSIVLTDSQNLKYTPKGDQIIDEQFAISPDGQTLLIWEAYYSNHQEWIRLIAMNSVNGKSRTLMQWETNQSSNLPLTDWISDTSLAIFYSGSTLGTIDANTGRIAYLFGPHTPEVDYNDTKNINHSYYSPSREWLLFSSQYASNQTRWLIINTTSAEENKVGPNYYPHEITCMDLIGRWDGPWSPSGQHLLCGCAKSGVNHACVFNLQGNVVFESVAATSSAEWAS